MFPNSTGEKGDLLEGGGQKNGLKEDPAERDLQGGKR